jgi:hypothetical protein
MDHSLFLILTILLSLFPDFLLAQKPARVDKGGNNPNETTIVINPKSPNFVTGASNINILYLSSDSGKTWTETTATTSLGIYGDPVLINDKNGKIYFAHLSKNLRKTGYNSLDKIVVQFSEDYGKTFSDGVGIGFNQDKMQDKPWMSLDEFDGSPFYGNLYISWTEFDKYGSKDPKDSSRIRFSRSSDGGKTFSEAITVSDKTGDCLDSDNTPEGVTTAALPDGTICITWSAFGSIWMDRSTDGGKTWGKDQAIASQVGGWDMDIEHIYRSNGFPFLVSDRSGGPHLGRLYMLWGDKRLGDADVWHIYSDDAGNTWSSPIRVHKDAESNGKDQFLGHIAVDPSSGYIYTIFYDRRHSANNVFMDTYLAWSEDGGQSFRNKRLTAHSFAPPGTKIFFGDYIGIAAQQNLIVPLWTEYHADLMLFSQALNFKNLSEKVATDTAFIIYIDQKNGLIALHYTDKVVGMIITKTWRFSRIFGKRKKSRVETLCCEENELVFRFKKNRHCKIKIDLYSEITHARHSVRMENSKLSKP